LKNSIHRAQPRAIGWLNNSTAQTAAVMPQTAVAIHQKSGRLGALTGDGSLGPRADGTAVRRRAMRINQPATISANGHLRRRWQAVGMDIDYAKKFAGLFARLAVDAN
jgi:hypothetical protein